MGYDKAIIDAVIEELNESEYDRLALMMVWCSCTPVSILRLMKLSQILAKMHAPGKLFGIGRFGRYMKDANESYSYLADIGLLTVSKEGYSVTGFGDTVMKTISTTDEMFPTVDKMERSLKNIDDRKLLAITYHFFPDSADHSKIRGAVDHIIDSMTLDGRHLEAWSADEFLQTVRSGHRLTAG